MIANLQDNRQLFQHPISPYLRLSVIVPAKDEEQYILATLQALRLQVDKLGKPISAIEFEVLVLTNNCSDDTFALCQKYQKEFPNFQLYVDNIMIIGPTAHIGTIRRLLMDAAYERLSRVVGSRGIIVSTDADSEVDQYWIYNILDEMDKGVDVVGGRIIPRGTLGLARMHHLRDVTYRFLKTRLESELDPSMVNPWPRHFQCHGPSMAVTCEVYDRAGRIPAIPYLEDEEFRKALIRVDAKFRHSTAVRIYTSARLDGRVDFGFSVQLQHWEGMTRKYEHQLVEPFDSLHVRLSLKNEVRSLWQALRAGREVSLEMSSLAFKMHLDMEDLKQRLINERYFEASWEHIEAYLVQALNQLFPPQPISQVIFSLRSYFSNPPEVRQPAYAHSAIAI